MEMEKRKQIAEETQKLEKRVAELEEEIGIHQHCVKNGLSFNSHSDYAMAVQAVRGAKGKQSGSGRLRIKNRGKEKVHHSNFVASSETSCYNNNVTAKKLYSIEKKLDNLSNYGFIKDLGRGFNTGLKKAKDKAIEIGNWLKNEWEEAKKEVKETGTEIWNSAKDGAKKTAKFLGSRRVIVNRTNTKICVTGNKKSGVPGIVYLYNGDSSSPGLYDADGVVILPDQKFYDNKNCNGNPHTSGVIKVEDGIGKAEVSVSKKDPKAYFIDAYNTRHIPLGNNEIKDWKLP